MFVGCLAPCHYYGLHSFSKTNHVINKLLAISCQQNHVAVLGHEPNATKLLQVYKTSMHGLASDFYVPGSKFIFQGQPHRGLSCYRLPYQSTSTLCAPLARYLLQLFFCETCEVISIFMISNITGWYDLCRTLCMMRWIMTCQYKLII